LSSRGGLGSRRKIFADIFSGTCFLFYRRFFFQIVTDEWTALHGKDVARLQRRADIGCCVAGINDNNDTPKFH
jgi:hypothetical protein